MLVLIGRIAEYIFCSLITDVPVTIIVDVGTIFELDVDNMSDGLQTYKRTVHAIDDACEALPPQIIDIGDDVSVSNGNIKLNPNISDDNQYIV